VLVELWGTDQLLGPASLGRHFQCAGAELPDSASGAQSRRRRHASLWNISGIYLELHDNNAHASRFIVTVSSDQSSFIQIPATPLIVVNARQTLNCSMATEARKSSLPHSANRQPIELFHTSGYRNSNAIMIGQTIQQ
jgi:hypothetical protein